jgi:hypothetical protein
MAGGQTERLMARIVVYVEKNPDCNRSELRHHTAASSNYQLFHRAIATLVWAGAIAETQNGNRFSYAVGEKEVAL